MNQHIDDIVYTRCSGTTGRTVKLLHKYDEFEAGDTYYGAEYVPVQQFSKMAAASLDVSKKNVAFFHEESQRSSTGRKLSVLLAFVVTRFKYSKPQNLSLDVSLQLLHFRAA